MIADPRDPTRVTHSVDDILRARMLAIACGYEDAVDVVHGHQQLALFNAHYDERRFLPIHVYDTATSRPVAVLLRTGAYWLMLAVRDAIPRPQTLSTAKFTTLRMCLIKIAARITETTTRVRIAFAAARPEAELFSGLARSLQLAGP